MGVLLYDVHNMGILSRLFFGPTGGLAPLGAATGGVQYGLIMPGQDQSHLATIAYSDLFGAASDIVDRHVAMSVAPLKRGRAIIVGSIADLPLVALRNGQPIDRQPRWLSRTETISSVWHRMAMTIDDLVFHGWSLWALQRSDTGAILDAIRVPFARWEFDDTTPLGIRVNDEPLRDAKSVILFPGPDEGVLSTGADIIRGARAMEEAWVGRVRNPIPAMVLHETERNGVTQSEARDYVNAWSTARQSPNGAIGFLPSTLNMEVYGDTTADLFTEGRNNVRLDVANLLNLPASVLDGSTATASLTYSTAQGEFSQLNAWLEYWLAPIEHRLSMNDVSPNGQAIRFDRGNLSSLSELGPAALAAEDEPAIAEEVAA